MSKIAVVHSGLLGASWNLGGGIVSTLKRMGHTVEAWSLGSQPQRPLHKEYLQLADLILVSGLEHFAHPDSELFKAISIEEWGKLTATRAAWFHESFFRDDRSFDFTAIRPLADKFFFPAYQDAMMFDDLHHGAHGSCHWLPFGVDTEIFKPMDGIQRDIPSGFIGSFYPKRVAYLNSLLRHIKVPFMAGGGVVVQDMDGLHARDTAIRLAQNYNRILVFLNLPAYSRLIVTKVLEAMACGCLVVTPALSGAAERNMETFQHLKHLVYYKDSNMGFVNQILREYIEREDDRRLIVAMGQQEVSTNHSLEVRLHKLLSLCGFEQSIPEERSLIVEP